MTKSRIITVLALTIHISLMAFNNIHAGTRAPTPAPTVLRDTVVRLSAGANHTCRVADDSSVQCWGENGSGQLGDGTTNDRDSPRTVSGGLTDVVAVAAGEAHSCALLVDGTVRCWGEGSGGRLGDGSASDRLTPVAVSGLTNAVAITAGSSHTCALIANGTARCWGSNFTGQVGDNTTSERPSPVTVLGLTNAVAISAGMFHTCAVIADGTARCWGAGGTGALGNNSTGVRRTPVAVLGLTNAVAIAAGWFHTCALIADGAARCWGSNSSGQLGDNSTSTRLIPVHVSNLTDAIAITAGQAHTCALRHVAVGDVACWGEGGSGQLLTGDTNDRLTPDLAIPIPPLNATAIAAGGAHTCALVGNEVKRCWGLNDSGQLGEGFTTTNIVANFSGARDIAAGDAHTCALRSNGTASCWGHNDHGQLGDGTTIERPTPVAVSGLTNAVAIAAGRKHTCVLDVGSVRCWGEGGSGRLGDNNTTDRLTPAFANLSGAVAIAAGNNHTCALLGLRGTVTCWGLNSSGQLGDGTLGGNRPSPSNSAGLVVSLTNAVTIAAGGSHTCALIADGTARCWGRNSEGQLGIDESPLNDHPLPTAVTGLTNVVAIAAGQQHTCALLADGTARCWGDGSNGRLGDGTTTDHITRVAVSGLSNAVGIAAGNAHTCALLANGTARCWGFNSSGQLGDGTDVQRPMPVTVTSGDSRLPGVLRGIVQLATGGDHTCARLANGGVRCWGSNSDGQIGDGSTSNRFRPVSVPSFTFNIEPVVELHGKKGEATVNVVAICEEGDRLQARVEITQGSARGQGSDNFECIGTLGRFPVKVHPQGKNTFLDGPAQAQAEADIKDRGLVEHQEWNRTVEIVSAP